MSEEKNPYDLEERTEKFAIAVRKFAKRIKVALINADDIKQVLRSSGSIGANYIEANESLSKKDFLVRVKISRKEAKETRYWLRVMQIEQPELDEEKAKLHEEATQLMKIFGSIITKSGG